jgi:hypothetical protein
MKIAPHGSRRSNATGSYVAVRSCRRSFEDYVAGGGVAVPVERIEVDGLVGLIRSVTELNGEEGSVPLRWFRGVKCRTYKLQPKIYRDGKSSEEVFEREGRLLNRFRQRSQAYWREGYPQNDWEQLFAMQHYGIPTRLLDWSENLLVAAFFASGVDSHDHADECVPAVWCVEPVNWNRATPVLSEFGAQIGVMNTIDDELVAYAPFSERRRQRSPLAIYGSHNTNRILAQRGTFMVWGNEPHPLEEVADTGTALVRKFEIGGGKIKLVRDLAKLGYTETMFFPDLDALATELTAMEGWK